MVAIKNTSKVRDMPGILAKCEWAVMKLMFRAINMQLSKFLLHGVCGMDIRLLNVCHYRMPDMRCYHEIIEGMVGAMNTNVLEHWAYVYNRRWLVGEMANKSSTNNRRTNVISDGVLLQ